MSTNNRYYQRLKRRLLQNVWVSRSVIIISAILMGIGILALVAKPVLGVVKQIWRGPKIVTTFFSNPLYTLPSYDGRTNVLFIGMGGEDHDGGQLTDTMIFVSMDLKNTGVTMLSIPRDIWVPSIEAKINAAYMVGAQESTAAGYLMLEDAVYEIVDQPIHYVVSLDFNGFEELVDAVGGVDVYVDAAFVDEWYPIRGKEKDECDGDPEYRCRYEVLRFEQGMQHMDGETALKFSRSRHADGDEGTDFARSARQQKIIHALKSKALSKEILLNPAKIFALKDLAMQFVTVNKELTDDDYAGLASFGYAFWRSGKEVKTMNFDMGDADNPGFLISPNVEKYGTWVLEPRSEDWKEFQGFFEQKLKEK